MKLGRVQIMVAHEMVARGVPVRQVARQFGVDEATLRYRLQRRPDAPDGRRARPTALDGWEAVVTAVLERCGDARVVAGSTTPGETRAVHPLLVREFGFAWRHPTGRRFLA